ncbi:MAG TPA: aldo/keto reductase [Stellaceae bacterium]|nr:aldo/keto reductase [Stellaceae bacterium]
MEKRILGRTGASVSVLGFGCGAVGGMMVRGAPADQARAVARALDAGINYFDTAAAYGNGASEENLGRVLKSLNPEIFLSTKFTVLPEHKKDIAGGIAQSLEQSLGRLGRDHVDLFQLHNRIASSGSDRPLDPTTVLDQVVPALEALRQQGKIRFFGITALGDTPALQKVVDAGAFDTAQICHNLLNPSASVALPASFPAQDFEKLAVRAHAKGMGTIGIRILAGGALSGHETRHPTGANSVDPIASGPDYSTDVKRAHAFQALVGAGYARSLIEASLRFSFASEAMTTVLVGTSTLDQLENAITCANKGPLTRAALDEAARLWRNIAGAQG